jgi:hypothetical protein
MSALLLTIGIAFAVIVIALGFMGISWLLTGRLSIRPGACGRDPTKKRNDEEGCGTDVNCMLCKKDEKKK